MQCMFQSTGSRSNDTAAAAVAQPAVTARDVMLAALVSAWHELGFSRSSCCSVWRLQRIELGQ